MTLKAGLDELFDPAVVQDPFPYYARLREQDPVHEIRGTGAYLVTRMAHVEQVCADTETFSSVSTDFLHLGDWPAPALRSATSFDVPPDAGVLAAADPPRHTRHRKVISRRLSTAAMTALGPQFGEVLRSTLAGVGTDSRLDWMSQVAEPLPVVMLARVFGLDDGAAPELMRQGYATMERIGGFVPEAEVPVLEAEGVQNLTVALAAFAEAQAGSTAYDHGLIGTLAHAVRDGELTDLEAFGTLGILVAAGGESTASLLGTAARILAEDPGLQQRLREDPALIPTFVEEALRWDPPFRAHYRTVTRDTELGGVPLPAGSRLLLVWGSANRDPDAFKGPDEIRLDRPRVRQHVGFGRGIHLCVGAPLARIEAKVALEVLLAGTRTFRIDPDAPRPSYHHSIAIRRLVSLPLVLERTG